MLRKLVNLVFALLILAGAGLVAQQLIDSREPLHSKPRTSEGPLVQVHTIDRNGADITLNSHGTVQTKTALQLTSDVAGRVTWVNPELMTGVILAADTVVARVDKTQYEVALAQANLALREAELSLADAHTRFKTHSPRHPQIRRAEAQVTAANAQIKKAETDLKRTDITLPVKALVASKQIALGQYVAPGSVLANLQAVDSVEIALPISQAELELLRSASSPVVRLTSVKGDSQWEAQLARVNQQLDQATRVAYAVAEVASPYEQTPPLRIGQFVEAHIQGISLDDVFRLPTTAIFENRFVYRLVDDNRLQRVNVNILRQDARSVVAQGNLAVNDQLVLSRLDIMTDGMQVRVDRTP
ncbi:efflux RND transporter periplasmic adaptor subunit [Litorivivens sp.]|uniref:efflux RND transporter periplasmic adaptor subunit n=1 Tax=Litorivivens sp. TaxID=2020868 RepID=UPI00356178D0